MKAWDHVRIEPSATEAGHADLFLMNEDGRACEVAIAHLPIAGEPSRMAVMDEPNWRLMLDALAEISVRRGREPWLPVETSDGDVWVHLP